MVPVIEREREMWHHEAFKLPKLQASGTIQDQARNKGGMGRMGRKGIDGTDSDL